MPTKLIRLISEDGQSFDIPMKVACLSEFVKTAIGGDDDDDDDDGSNDDDDDEIDTTTPVEEAKESNTEEKEKDSNNNMKVVFEIPVPKVSGCILQRVIEFCTHYIQIEPMKPIARGPLPTVSSLSSTSTSSSSSQQNIITMNDIVQPPWYATFITTNQNNSKDILFELLLAANFMDIKPLLELTGATIATQIQGKETEEMREYFNIQNDFTPEEERRIRSEFQWCEEVEEEH